MNDKVLNAYSDNAEHNSGSSLEMEDLPQNPKHNVYENPKPKANQIHPFFETIHWFHSKKISFQKRVLFIKNSIRKRFKICSFHMKFMMSNL